MSRGNLGWATQKSSFWLLEGYWNVGLHQPIMKPRIPWCPRAGWGYTLANWLERIIPHFSKLYRIKCNIKITLPGKYWCIRHVEYTYVLSFILYLMVAFLHRLCFRIWEKLLCSWILHLLTIKVSLIFKVSIHHT